LGSSRFDWRLTWALVESIVKPDAVTGQVDYPSPAPSRSHLRRVSGRRRSRVMPSDWCVGEGAPIRTRRWYPAPARSSHPGAQPNSRTNVTGGLPIPPRNGVAAGGPPPRPARNPRPPRPRRGPWPVAPIRTATNTRPGRSRSQHIQMPSPSPAQGLTLQGQRCHSRIGQITRPPPEAARLQGDTAISAPIHNSRARPVVTPLRRENLGS